MLVCRCPDLLWRHGRSKEGLPGGAAASGIDTRRRAGYIMRPWSREVGLAEFSERELRDALGRFATGVTVVTTMSARGPLGITANSFASVSLDPPLVLWSPARKSRRFPDFEAASHFAIHVLSAGQKAMAERFAQPGEGIVESDFAIGIGDAPLLEGCTARFECRHAAGYEGGDHLIVVGEVLRLVQADLPPLLYHRGRYCGLTIR